MSDIDSTHKACARCGVTKPLFDFYPHASTPGALARRCKKCARAATMESRSKKRDLVLERQRIQQRNMSEEMRQRRNARGVRYRETQPERISAVKTLNLALRHGTISRYPCWVCGDTKVEAHHPDYSSPLDVVWLCPSHHRQTHALTNKPGPKPKTPL